MAMAMMISTKPLAAHAGAQPGWPAMATAMPDHAHGGCPGAPSSGLRQAAQGQDEQDRGDEVGEARSG